MRPSDGERHACAEGECDGALPGGPSYLVLDAGQTRFDDTGALLPVPEVEVFVLGDNRGKSADSRIPVKFGGMGMIALDSLIRVAKVPE